MLFYGDSAWALSVSPRLEKNWPQFRGSPSFTLPALIEPFQQQPCKLLQRPAKRTTVLCSLQMVPKQKWEQGAHIVRLKTASKSWNGSNRFPSLSKYLGAEQIRTTAYHPQSNGAVKRFHRQLKSTLMTHLPENWLDALPLVLLGIRTSFKRDLATSSAELVYGSTFKLTGECFSNTSVATSASSFLQTFKSRVSSFRPVLTSHHCSGPVFVTGDLLKASHVFLRLDRIRKSLESPYAGPCKVLSRTSKVFTVEVDGRPVTVSIDRLKAAHVFPHEDFFSSSYS
ncbi:hypothetical protein AVEN_273234-1 [Araneus ventricosus]|uniref:Integrase catalytic domain-containing protein n=1 Tax=Araneus ventricosus TaxID=182803 RepID=A0A4Y2IUZ2_ARAVE|nr:hypothetical protein AVEN_273234-1 [Araneus ventricosus]